MLKNLEGARLGLFIFLGTVLLFVAIFLIGNKESLFVETITVKTYFSNIEGLRSGASVRLSGLNIGSVSSINLVENKQDRVEVIMRIENEVTNFIRLDSEASIETEGLVGAKIISITPGTPNYEMVKDGGLIKSENPVNMAEIIKESKRVINNLGDITENFALIVTKVNQGEGTIGNLINNDELYHSAVSITNSADKSLKLMTQRMDEVSTFIIDLGTGLESIIANVDSGVTDVRHFVESIENGDGTIGKLISKDDAYDSLMVVMHNLTGATENAKSGAESLAENMEALKHNWLFKSYFEQRGYWSKSEYDEQITKKLQKLEIQRKELDEKIKELRELEEKTNARED
ncbi:MAG: MCE family protein [Melioribacteraceae bacterium]|nr:MCE family protein [Melioribacteraceae bacterium]